MTFNRKEQFPTLCSSKKKLQAPPSPSTSDMFRVQADEEWKNVTVVRSKEPTLTLVLRAYALNPVVHRMASPKFFGALCSHFAVIFSSPVSSLTSHLVQHVSQCGRQRIGRIFSRCRLEPFSAINCLRAPPPARLRPVHPRRRGGKRQRERIRTPFSVAALRRRPVPLSPFHLADLCVMLDHSRVWERPSSTNQHACFFPR